MCILTCVHSFCTLTSSHIVSTRRLNPPAAGSGTTPPPPAGAPPTAGTPSEAVPGNNCGGPGGNDSSSCLDAESISPAKGSPWELSMIRLVVVSPLERDCDCVRLDSDVPFIWGVAMCCGRGFLPPSALLTFIAS